MELEKDKLAKFRQLSYGFSTIASAIPAYSKRNKMIFSRQKAKLYYSKRLGFAYLKKLLLDKILDKKNPKLRKLLVAEVIFMDTGEIVGSAICWRVLCWLFAMSINFIFTCLPSVCSHFIIEHQTQCSLYSVSLSMLSKFYVLAPLE